MIAALNLEEVSQIVKNNFPGKDLEVVEFRAGAVSVNPTGFLGEHERLTVRIRRGKEVVRRKYFVKKIPGQIAQKDYVQQLRCFYRETGMYEVVFPALKEHASKIPKWHPDFYFSRGEELLVLEDLTESGYYMYPERRLMDEEHVLRSLEALAAMHASSIIYEEKLKESGNNTTLAETFSDYLSEWCNSDHWSRTREAAVAAQVKIVDLLEGYTAEQKETIKRELPFRMKRLIFLSKPSQKFRNVIIHGDLWANNLLFAKDNNGNVKGAKMVDFQLARYAPPAQDIVTLLYLVQSKEFREKNYLKLYRHYFDALSSCLEKHGLKSEGVISWYELLGTCDYYEELGLVTAILFFQLVLIPPELCKKFLGSFETQCSLEFDDRGEFVTECFLNDSSYRERVTEAMKILIDEYIL